MAKLMGLFFLGVLLSTNLFAATPAPNCRCQPGQPCWPSTKDWAELAKQVHGRLIQPASPIAACQTNPSSTKCLVSIKNIHNPFYNEDDPGATESQGWLGAWQSSPSTYAVAAESPEDVVAAVNFARKHHLKVVIKGTGHDYLGRSNAANSLLIWTHKMRATTTHDAFVPAGCPINTKPVTAITVSAGTRWLEAYGETTTKHHRYVQGGGCTTVGAAGGFPQGGGFGSYSKKYGTGAAGMLQAEVVTADGKVLIVNECQNWDLFWALRGGGGSTFGVVTKLTLLAHELPESFGIIKANITANTADAYKQLLQYFLRFYMQQLNNEHRGEQITFNTDNTIKITMLYQGLTTSQVEAIWQPLTNWIKQRQDAYIIQSRVYDIPPQSMWDYQFWRKTYPEFVSKNTQPGAAPGEYWWLPNSKEVSQYWYAYQSWWLPVKLFKDTGKLAQLFFDASRVAPFTLHANKGLAGASEDAKQRTRETSTNPSALDAAGLIIMARGSNTVSPAIPGSEPDEKSAQADADKINRGIRLFMNAAPGAGTYVNEADYFLKDWQTAFWGTYYTRLNFIKNKYDPDGVFYCHHCVGSESWSEDGMCRIKVH